MKTRKTARTMAHHGTDEERSQDGTRDPTNNGGAGLDGDLGEADTKRSSDTKGPGGTGWFRQRRRERLGGTISDEGDLKLNKTITDIGDLELGEASGYGRLWGIILSNSSNNCMSDRSLGRTPTLVPSYSTRTPTELHCVAGF